MKYNGHSGASFGFCMRHMENYAKNGAEAYAWKYAKNAQLRASFLKEITD
jgi:hypothetical protein